MLKLDGAMAPRLRRRGMYSARLLAAVIALCAAVPVHGAGPALPLAPARALAYPVVDGAYVQAQLIRLVTRDPRREAGQLRAPNGAWNGHDRFAADWLAALRAALGDLPLHVQRQFFPLPGFRGRPPRTAGANIIATIPGATRANEWVLVVAHYDGTPVTTDSAYDDASGCAILLGIARALAPRWRLHRPARTVAFVLFDGEEQGLVGSLYNARAYRQGAPYRIVALYNEEQNGVGYPVRPFGLATNPLLPEHVLVTPRRHGNKWAGPVAPSLWPGLARFSVALAGARARAFAALHVAYPRLGYRTTQAAIFTPADQSLVPIGDDYVGGSDQAPFERLGLPTATLVGNFDNYMGHPARPWSYPNDTPRDTLALLERIAAGMPRPSPALAAALAGAGRGPGVARADHGGDAPYERLGRRRCHSLTHARTGPQLA